MEKTRGFSPNRAVTIVAVLLLLTRFNLNDRRAPRDFVGKDMRNDAMPMRQLIVIGTVLLAVACGGPTSAPGPQAGVTPAAESSPAAQLGGPPAGAGPLAAHRGEDR